MKHQTMTASREQCIHGWPWGKPITIPGVEPQYCCATREDWAMNDMQFSTEEEKRLDAEEREYLDQLDAEEMAEFELFMEEAAENDERLAAMEEAVVDGMTELGQATSEEVAEIAKKYGIE